MMEKTLYKRACTHCGHMTGQFHYNDEEVERLREAVEWAIEHPPIGLVGFPNMTMPEIVTWWRNELRRKVKEG